MRQSFPDSDIDPMPEGAIHAEVIPHPSDPSPSPSPDDDTRDLLFETPPEPVSEITSTCGILTVSKDNVVHTNRALSYISAAFDKTRDSNDLCRLVLTMCKVLETRQKLLCMQYGAPKYAKRDEGPRRSTHEPLDD